MSVAAALNVTVSAPGCCIAEAELLFEFSKP
jgi:hypothetical protein